MKKHFISILFLFFYVSLLAQIERKETGNLIIENIPDIPNRIFERTLQYQNTRSASFLGWLPENNGMLISTRFGETAQIHKLEKPGGARTQITFFKEPVGGGVIPNNPNFNGFLFSKDVGGNEFYQIYYFNMGNGSWKLLTDGKSRHGGIVWSNKSDKFSYYSTQRNGSDWDIYISSVNNPELAKPILSKGGAWSTIEWSPDDSKILVSKYISANESQLHILDLATLNLEQINPSKEKIAYGPATWLKNGTGIFVTSNEGSEFNELKYYDFSSKKFTSVTKDIPWNVENIALSDDGEKLAFTINEDGISKLFFLDTESMKYDEFENIPIGIIYGLEFNKDNIELALVINTPKTPSDIYSINTDSKKITRWTNSEVGGLNTNSFVEPELIHYPTFDRVNGEQRTIPAFVYKPQNRKSPFPVLINIHGGPEAQARPSFSSTLQYWVNELGIAVIVPNVRGSSGYGKTYLSLDNGFKREESVQDIGKLLDWIESQPEFDASKIGVIGGSYGGYMVLASMTNFNDRLKCAIDIVGISNFVTFLENTQDYRRDLRRVEYGDERLPEMREFLLKISPTTNANKITKPLFIVQGLNDPRVPATEAEQILQSIRDNGTEAWFLLAKDEGHGFAKKSNQDFYNNSTILFLEKFLLN